MSDEARLAEFSRYGEDEVARATVHTRQDAVMLVSQLSSLNSQIRVIKWLLAILAIGVIVIAYRI